MRRITVRFDVTHAGFSEAAPYAPGGYTIDRHRTYLKVAVMLRVPWKGVLLK